MAASGTPITASGGGGRLRRWVALATSRSSAGGGRAPVLLDNALVVGGIGILNVANYAVYVVAARMLDPDEFGGVVTLLGIITSTAVLALASQLVAAREAATADSLGMPAPAASVAKHLTWRIGALAALAAGGIAVVAVTSSNAFDLDSPLPMLLAAVSSGLYIIKSMYRGAWQGARRYLRLSANYAVEGALKLPLVWILLAMGTGASGAMAGITIALLAAAVLLIVPVWFGHGRTALPPPERVRLVRVGLPVVMGIGGLAVLMNFDTVYVRLFLGGDESGEYGAAATLARAVYWAPAGVAIVMLSSIARVDVGSRRPHFWFAMALAGVIALSATVFIWALSGPIFDTAFGDDYRDAAQYGGPMAFAGLCLALATVSVYYGLGERRWGTLPPLLVGVATQPVLFALFHDSLGEVVAVQVGVAATTAAFVTIAALLPHRQAVTHATRHEDQRSEAG